MSTSLRIALGLVLIGAGSVAANTTPQVSLSQNWSNASLITINDDWSQVPGIMGRLGDGLTNSGGIDPQTVLADQPTVDVIANQSVPGTLMAGGVAEFDGIADRVVALQGSGTADAPFLLLTLDTSGQSSVTVSYKLRDIDDSSDNALTPVALQYRIGTTGDFTNIPAGYVADATTGPNLATLVTPVSVVLPAAVSNRPVVQLRIITTNAVSTDEWVGIDDIQVTAGPSCFSDITSGLPPLRASRVAWGDYDNDTDMDLLVTGDIGGSVVTRVYRSSGGLNPVFHDITAPLPGLIGPEVAWVDYDVDGDLDIFVSGATADSSLTRIYRNNGIPNPTFTDAQAGLPGMPAGAAAWGDYDNDGDPDLLQTGQYGRGQPYATRLYRNDRGAVPVFTLVPTNLPGAREGDVAWGDYDNDGDLDILMAGITEPGTLPLVFRNDGDEVFTSIGAGDSDNSGVAVDWGDYDADGDLDALVARQNYIDIRTNQVAGMVHSFAAVLPPYTPGVMQGTTTWGDYDNDGRLDFLSTGYDFWAFRPATNLFRQVPASPYFEYVGTGMPGIGDDPTPDGLAGGAWGDADGDLDLDVVLAGGAFTGVPTTRVYRNVCGANTAPTAPTGLSVTVVGLRATFSWSAATDAETPAAGLSYNLRVGTAP
ncbi:MAG TPA: VCBS repeat-containing protein, partial [Candidatus Eisenbacteria bacterium]